jgi:hypothetical protein
VSDARLRDLERLARAGDASAALRWATELERAGGGPDAVLDALLLAREQPEGRETLGARWEARHLPSTGWCDVELPAAPRERWSATVEAAVRFLLASPLGVLACGEEASWLLDPDGGQVRARLPGCLGAGDLGSCLVLMQGGGLLSCHDAWTGALLHCTPGLGELTDVALGAGLLVAKSGTDRLEAYHLDARGTSPAWSRPLGFEGRVAWNVGLAPGLVVVPYGRSLAVLTSTGTVRAKIDGVVTSTHMDAAGVLAFTAQDGGRVPDLALFTPDGQEVWRRPGVRAVIALTPQVVVAHPLESEGEVLVLERATGEERSRVVPEWREFLLFVARNQVCWASDAGVVARELGDGAVRWQLDGPHVLLTAGHRRLYGVRDGEIVCYE